MYWGPLFENALHRVLHALDLLFKGVMNGIHIKDTDGSVCCAEKAVWEDCYVLIVWVSFTGKEFATKFQQAKVLKKLLKNIEKLLKNTEIMP